MYGKYQSGKACSYLTVGFVSLAFFGGEWWVYNISCHPTVLGALLFNFIFVLALWSYLATACTNPGTAEAPGEEWDSCLSGAPSEPPPADEPVRRGWKPGEITWCKSCAKYRPERAHHCAVCGVCVMRMDHHCPWIGNCVGWRNHKYFILLNLWAFLACLTLLLTMSGPSAGEALVGILEVSDADGSGRSSASAPVLPMLGVGVALILCLVTGGMFLHCLHMSSRNVTAVEELFHGENPYCAESCWTNIRQIMGPLDWRILLPMEPEREAKGWFKIQPRKGDAGDKTYGAV